MRVCCHFSRVQLSATPWTVVHQAPPPMGFSRQEYWNGLAFPSLRDLPDPGIEPTSLMPPALAGRFFATSTTWEALWWGVQFSSATQSCPTLCDPMDCSTPGFPVHRQLPECTQIHVHQGRWCHPTISSSVIPFFYRLQSFPASESFPMSQFFTSRGQSSGVAASASVLPGIIQDWFHLGWTG